MGPRIRRWLANGGIILGALLFLMLGLGNHLYLVSARKLVESGAQAEGVVTERIGRKGSNSYSFHYRFAAAGREYSGLRRPAPYRMREELEPGARIRVWYDASDPSKNMTQAELADLESGANRLFFPVAGAALLGWAIARMRRAARRR